MLTFFSACSHIILWYEMTKRSGTKPIVLSTWYKLNMLTVDCSAATFSSTFRLLPFFHSFVFAFRVITWVYFMLRMPRIEIKSIWWKISLIILLSSKFIDIISMWLYAPCAWISLNGSKNTSFTHLAFSSLWQLSYWNISAESFILL